MVQSWLILSAFVLVPGTLDEPRPHFLDALWAQAKWLSNNHNGVCPLRVSLCLERMNRVPQLRPNTGEHSRRLVKGGWKISEAGEGAVERGPETKATLQTTEGKAFWTNTGMGQVPVSWSGAQVEGARLSWGHTGLTLRTKSTLHLLAMQGWAQGTREGTREGGKPRSSSYTRLALQSSCWRSRGGKEDPGSISGSIMSQGWRPPRAGWEPLWSISIRNSSHQPTVPDAAHTWLVCPQLLRTPCECSQVILLKLRLGPDNRGHTQNDPLSLSLAAAGNHRRVTTAIRTQVETQGRIYSALWKPE